MKRCIQALDILFLARPVILVPVWGFSIFGYWCGNRLSSSFEVPIMWGTRHMVVFGSILIFSLSVGAVYVLNQIADAAVDEKNDGFPLLTRSGIRKKNAFWYAAFLSGMAIVIPLFFGGITLAFFSIAAIVLGTLYSFKPVYLSGRPFTDFLTNAIGYSLVAFGVGWYLSPRGSIFEIAFLHAALPYFLLMCGGSISSTLPDVAGDKACGKKTTAVALGAVRAHGITLGCIIAGGIAAYFTQDLCAIIIAVEFFCIDILYFIRQTEAYMEATYKVTGSIAMLCAGVIYPLFIPAAIAVFILTWLYFRFRFGVSYPSLVPVSHETK